MVGKVDLDGDWVSGPGLEDAKAGGFLRCNRVLTPSVHRTKPKIDAWEPVAKPR